MTPKDLRSKTLEDLKALEVDLRDELFKLKMQAGLGTLEKSHRLGEIKRDIARILTLVSDKKRQAEQAAS